MYKISSHFFIKIKAGQSIIILKEKSHNNNIVHELRNISKELKIEWNEELDWRWK